MTDPSPIDIDALDEETLEVARAAAEAAGMSLEDWLAKTLGAPQTGIHAPPGDNVVAGGESPLAGGGSADEVLADMEETVVMALSPTLGQPTAFDAVADESPENPETAAGIEGAEPSAHVGESENQAGDAAATDDLAEAVRDLAAILAPETNDARWTRRIAAISAGRPDLAPKPERAGPHSVSDMAASDPPPMPPMARPGPDLKSEPPTAEPTSAVQPDSAGPRLDPPRLPPPAPVVEPMPTPAARPAATDAPAQNGGALEKAIAAAEERRRVAGDRGMRSPAGGAAGWLVKLLIGVLVLVSAAVIAVLVYAWVNEDTNLDEIVSDLSDRANGIIDGAVSQLDLWLGGDATPAEPAAPLAAGPDPTTDPVVEPSPTVGESDATTSGSTEADQAGADTTMDEGPTAASSTEAGPPVEEIPVIEEDDSSADIARSAQPATDAGNAGAGASEFDQLEARASDGDPVAQRMLGQRHLSGDGVALDPDEAYFWLELAAVGEDPMAQYLLGTLYESGEGVAADPLIAMAWYLSASQLDLPEAGLRLGRIYSEGELWPQSYGDAADQFRIAADAGLAEAEFALADLYANGLGVELSPILAHVWFSRAAAHGDPQARIRAAAIADTLAPAELQQAESMMDDPPPTHTQLYGVDNRTPTSEGQSDAAAAAVDPAAADETSAAEANADTGVPEAAASTDTPAPAGDDRVTDQPVEDVGEPRAVATIPEVLPVPATEAGVDGATRAATDDAAAEAAADLIAPAQLSPAAIQEIQTLLNGLGFESGRPDGVAGRRTIAAISAYQLAEGLSADGQPSLSLLARLRSEAR